MIKHEEVNKIKIAKERFNKMIDILSIEDIETINQVLTEQQKKDELLGLYRMLVDKEEEYNTSDNTIKRMNLVELLMSLRLEIKALEEEMK